MAAVMSSALEMPQVNWTMMDEMKKRMADFTLQFDNFIATGREQLRKEKHAFVTGMTEDRNQQRAQLQAIEKSKLDEEELVETIKNERVEAEELGASIAEYASRQTDMSEQKTILEQQIAEAEATLAKKRASMSVKRLELASQHAKNKPEMQAWESQLGLEIETAGKDLLNFTYTHIHPQDHSRPFTMTVDVSAHDYMVADCRPTLPAMDGLVAQLNNTRDFSAFLKSVRKAFRDLHSA